MSFDSETEYFHSLSSVGIHLTPLQRCVSCVGYAVRTIERHYMAVPFDLHTRKK